MRTSRAVDDYGGEGLAWWPGSTQYRTTAKRTMTGLDTGKEYKGADGSITAALEMKFSFGLLKDVAYAKS